MCRGDSGVEALLQAPEPGLEDWYEEFLCEAHDVQLGAAGRSSAAGRGLGLSVLDPSQTRNNPEQPLCPLGQEILDCTPPQPQPHLAPLGLHTSLASGTRSAQERPGQVQQQQVQQLDVHWAAAGTAAMPSPALVPAAAQRGPSPGEQGGEPSGSTTSLARSNYSTQEQQQQRTALLLRYWLLHRQQQAEARAPAVGVSCAIAKPALQRPMLQRPQQQFLHPRRLPPRVPGLPMHQPVQALWPVTGKADSERGPARILQQASIQPQDASQQVSLPKLQQLHSPSPPAGRAMPFPASMRKRSWEQVHDQSAGADLALEGCPGLVSSFDTPHRTVALHHDVPPCASLPPGHAGIEAAPEEAECLSQHMGAGSPPAVISQAKRWCRVTTATGNGPQQLLSADEARLRQYLMLLAQRNAVLRTQVDQLRGMLHQWVQDGHIPSEQAQQFLASLPKGAHLQTKGE